MPMILPEKRIGYLQNRTGIQVSSSPISGKFNEITLTVNSSVNHSTQGFRQPAVLAVLIMASLEYKRPEEKKKKHFLGFF